MSDILTTDQIYDVVSAYFPGEEGRVLYRLGVQAPLLRADVAVKGGAIIGVTPPSGYTQTTLDPLLAAIAARTGEGMWGSITGTLSNQTDLQAALNAKQGVLVNSVSNAIVGTEVQRAALTGDVTAAANSNATTIVANAVTNAKLADVPTASLKGRVTAGAGDPEDLTPAQARSILNVADGATNTPLSTTNPAALGTAAVGTGTTAARADHVHPLANASDAELRDRATHTGTQPLSSLSQSGATTNQVATWNGTAWAPATPSGGAGAQDFVLLALGAI